MSMSKSIGYPELQPPQIPEIAAHSIDTVRHLGSITMGAYIEGRLSESGQDYNEFTTNAAAMLGVDELQLASDVFSAVGNGEEDLQSLYDRWHQERPSDGVQGPMLPPTMLKQGVAKQLGFEDVRSMAAAAHEHHRMFEEMQRLHDRDEEDEEEKDEKPGSVAHIGYKQRRKQYTSSRHQEAA
jgi:hypothetical protein